MVKTGEEKATAEKSPMGSLSIASNTQRSMAPPSTAWASTLARLTQQLSSLMQLDWLQ